jgi:hypothetical protein
VGVGEWEGALWVLRCHLLSNHHLDDLTSGPQEILGLVFGTIGPLVTKRIVTKVYPKPLFQCQGQLYQLLTTLLVPTLKGFPQIQLFCPLSCAGRMSWWVSSGRSSQECTEVPLDLVLHLSSQVRKPAFRICG